MIYDPDEWDNDTYDLNKTTYVYVDIPISSNKSNSFHSFKDDPEFMEMYLKMMHPDHHSVDGYFDEFTSFWGIFNFVRGVANGTAIAAGKNLTSC